MNIPYKKTLGLYTTVMALMSSHAFAASQFSLNVSPSKLVVGTPTNITYTLKNTGPDINNFYLRLDSQTTQVLVIKNGGVKTEFIASIGPSASNACPKTSNTAITFKSQSSCTLNLIANPPIIGNLVEPPGNLLSYTLNGTAITAPFPALTQNIIPSALFNFGDSYSDNGNLYFMRNGVRVPVAPDPGKWTALVSADMGYTNLPSRLGGTNYAIGGSITGPIPIVSVVNGALNTTIRMQQIADDQANMGLKMDLQAQVARFMQDHPQADPNALYFIWSGGNDMGTYTQNYNLDQQYKVSDTTMRTQIVPGDANIIANNLLSAVTAVQSVGAKYIVVVNLAASSSPNAYVRLLPGLANTQLATKIADLNAKNNGKPGYQPVQIISIDSIFSKLYSGSVSPNCGFKPLTSICIPSQDPNCTSPTPVGICCSSRAMGIAVIPFLTPKMCNGPAANSPGAIFFNTTLHPTYGGYQFLGINFEQLLFLPQPKVTQ